MSLRFTRRAERLANCCSVLSNKTVSKVCLSWSPRKHAKTLPFSKDGQGINTASFFRDRGLQKLSGEAALRLWNKWTHSQPSSWRAAVYRLASLRTSTPALLGL